MMRKHRIRATAMSCVVSAFLISGVSAAEQTHPYHIAQSGDPEDIRTVIEIPAGSAIKYEIDTETGHVMVDRMVSMAVNYPGNYGMIPGTLAGDGDPLDVLVLTREPIHPGALINVRPIGVLKMIDGGEEDDKVIAVPTSKVDPHYDHIQSIEDLPLIERERIEKFFAVYKMLPQGRKVVKLGGFADSDTAIRLVGEALDRYGR